MIKCLKPNFSKSFAIATPAAPVPLITTFTSSFCLSVTFRALIRPARVTTAVPCWSSCITGMPRSWRACSISKHSGALKSSRFIPPKTGEMFFIVSMVFLVSWSLMQIGNASMSANSLNNTHLPSITGSEASGPIFPNPSTAEPSLITATVFPLRVYL